MAGHPTVYVVSAYLSSSKTLLQSDLEALFALGDSVIVARDFNTRHITYNNPANTHKGTILHQLENELIFDVIAPLEPTHYKPNCRPTVIDVAILKEVTLQVRHIEVIHELDSDHHPVLLLLGQPNDHIPPQLKWLTILNTGTI